MEDPSVLVATYEGEHNHEPISHVKIPFASIDLDLKKTSPFHEEHRPDLQHFLVQQMASSLTKDPNFTAALAAAVTGRMSEKW